MLSARESTYKAIIHQEFGKELIPDKGESWVAFYKRLTKEIFRSGPNLYKAAELGCSRAIKTILKDGIDIDINAKEKTLKYTALHAAALYGHKSAVKVLIAHGADPYVKYYGMTPLDLAANSRESSQVFSLLPATSLSPNIFFNLILNAEFEAVDLLLQQGVDINLKNDDMEGCLHIILQNSDTKSKEASVAWAITRGADVKAKDIYGITPLHYAFGRSDLNSVDHLLDQGAELSAMDQHENTPLHWALWKGNPQQLFELEKMQNTLMIKDLVSVYSLKCSIKLLKYTTTLFVWHRWFNELISHYTPSWLKRKKD